MELNLEAFEGTRVLITGGLGFLGSNLARRLVIAGARVSIVDSLSPNHGGNPRNIADIRDQVDVEIADLRQRETLDGLLVHDYLFNLAGQSSHLDSMHDPVFDLDANARIHLALLERCRRANCKPRIVYTSTRQVYGRPRTLPVSEDHPLQPVDVNGVSKLAGESYHLLYGANYDLPVTVLRLTNTYGPGMRIRDARQTFLGIWIRKVLTGEDLEVYGDGTQLRDLNYIDDVCDALLRAATVPGAPGQIYNLGSTEVVSLLALAQVLVDLAGRGKVSLVPFPEDRLRIDIGSYHADFAKARRELGWQPATTAREGLEKTLAYYRVHLQHYI